MEQSTHKKNHRILKIFCVLLAVILMLGISTAVSLIVHKNGGNATAENGLSAYALAVQCGYEGSVQDWLASLKGKSAYEIAVENGYSGTQEDWAKALNASAAQEYTSISSAKFSPAGELVLVLSDGTELNLGQATGASGKDGTPGKDGADGAPGKDGSAGKDGIGIANSEINDHGELVLTYSDGSKVNLGRIVGVDGSSGQDGAVGIGVKHIAVSEDGQLVITLTDNTVQVVGSTQGEQGPQGEPGIPGAQGPQGVDGKSAYELYKEAYPDYTGTMEQWLADLKGAQGEAGRGIVKTEISGTNWIIYYTDGTTETHDLSGMAASDDEFPAQIHHLLFKEKADGTYSVALNSVYANWITSVDIPATYKGKAVTEIANNGFKDAVKLKVVNIPNSVVSIGTSAFANCAALRSIELPVSLTTVSNFAFSGCALLTTVTLHDGITQIGNSAFYQCFSLNNIVLPDSLKQIGINVFRECCSLTEITIPAGVTQIRERMFFGCTSLKSVELPVSMEIVPDYMFSGCTSLTTVIMHEKITDIGVSSFEGCTSLKDFVLPDSLTTIRDQAFYGCTSLTEIRIPAAVTYIGQLAFAKTSLQAAYFEDPIGWETVYDKDSISIRKKLSEEVISDPAKLAAALTDDTLRYEGIWTGFQFYDYFEKNG